MKTGNPKITDATIKNGRLDIVVELPNVGRFMIQSVRVDSVVLESSGPVTAAKIVIAGVADPVPIVV